VRNSNDAIEIKTAFSVTPFAIFLIAAVALDQVTKFAIVEWLGPGASSHRWELAGKYLALEYVENRGAAFSILEGQTTLLIILAIAVAVGFVALVRKELARSYPLQAALSLIVAGAIGNLADRIRLGHVVDFVAVGVWPKFNVADTCVTIAILILAWTSFFPSSATKPDAKDTTRD
jgi:signal peptidase II